MEKYTLKIKEEEKWYSAILKRLNIITKDILIPKNLGDDDLKNEAMMLRKIALMFLKMADEIDYLCECFYFTKDRADFQYNLAIEEEVKKENILENVSYHESMMANKFEEEIKKRCGISLTCQPAYQKILCKTVSIDSAHPDYFEIIVKDQHIIVSSYLDKMSGNYIAVNEIVNKKKNNMKIRDYFEYEFDDEEDDEDDYLDFDEED